MYARAIGLTNSAPSDTIISDKVTIAPVGTQVNNNITHKALGFKCQQQNKSLLQNKILPENVRLPANEVKSRKDLDPHPHRLILATLKPTCDTSHCASCASLFCSCSTTCTTSSLFIK